MMDESVASIAGAGDDIKPYKIHVRLTQWRYAQVTNGGSGILQVPGADEEEIRADQAASRASTSSIARMGIGNA